MSFSNVIVKWNNISSLSLLLQMGKPYEKLWYDSDDQKLDFLANDWQSILDIPFYKWKYNVHWNNQTRLFKMNAIFSLKNELSGQPFNEAFTHWSM